MELTWIPPLLNKKYEFKCSLFSGFYGMIQDEKTFNVRPVIGYTIVVDDKTESDITKEERDKIIKEYTEENKS